MTPCFRTHAPGAVRSAGPARWHASHRCATHRTTNCATNCATDRASARARAGAMGAAHGSAHAHPGPSPAAHPSACAGRHTAQRGLAVVEFALVLPVLLTVLLAVLELGVMLYNQAVLTQASREGARVGIVLRDPKPSEREIRTAVLARTQGALIALRSTASPEVVVQQSASASAPDPLRVTVRYPYAGLALGPLLSALDQPVVLSATTVMVNE